MERAIILRHLLVKGISLPPLDQLGLNTANWSAQDRVDFELECRSRYAVQVEKLQGSGLWDKMESEEHLFLEAGPYDLSPQSQLDAMWLAESIGCLHWALGYASELPAYDKETGQEIINGAPNESTRNLVASAKLRPVNDIDVQRDLAELWHWRCRTRQLSESGHKFAELPQGTAITDIVKMAANKAGETQNFVPIGNDFPAFEKPFRDATNHEFLQLQSIAQERHKALNWLCGYAPGNRWSETPTDT
jgi:hypothetical protein